MRRIFDRGSQLVAPGPAQRAGGEKDHILVVMVIAGVNGLLNRNVKSRVIDHHMIVVHGHHNDGQTVDPMTAREPEKHAESRCNRLRLHRRAANR